MTLTLPRLSQRGIITLTLTGISLLTAAIPVAAQSVQERAAADGFVARYQRTEDWAVRAVQWLSLGGRTTRSLNPVLLEAFQAKDRHLRVYALEALAGLDDDILAYLPDAALAEELILDQLKEKNERYQARLCEVLERTFPEAPPALLYLEEDEVTLKDQVKSWQKWWKAARKTWEPAPWPGDLEPEERSGETVATGFVSRAMDLSRSGLEVALVIDSTGSMQPTINAARTALEDLALILDSLTPRFKIGIVHYKDHMDMGKGASELQKLTKDVKKVKKRLSKLRADGGGDFPEALEAGLRVCLAESFGWSPEASKLVVVVADAPGHPQEQEAAEKLAKDAVENPFGRPAVIPDPDATGTVAGGANRPFVISCIGISPALPVNAQTVRSLQGVATAGGGTYTEIATNGRRDEAALALLSQVLVQSFGPRFEDQVDLFLEIYLPYFREGFFEK